MWYKHGKIHETSDCLQTNSWLKEHLYESLIELLPSHHKSYTYFVRFLACNFHLRVFWEYQRMVLPESFSRFDKRQTAHIFVPIEMEGMKTRELRRVKLCVGTLPIIRPSGVIIYNAIPRAFVLRLMKRIGLDYTIDASDSQRVRLAFSKTGNLSFFWHPLDSLATMVLRVVIRVQNTADRKVRKIILSLNEFLRLQGIDLNQVVHYSRHTSYFVRPIPNPFNLIYSWREDLNMLNQQQLSLKATVPVQKTNTVTQRTVFSQSSSGIYYSRSDYLNLVEAFIDTLLGYRPYLDADHMGNRLVSTWGTSLLRCIKSVLEKNLKRLDSACYRPLDKLPKIRRLIYSYAKLLNKFFQRVNMYMCDSIYETVVMNPLSQYLDQTNILAESIHLHKLSSKALGGSKPTPALRDVAPSSFSRLCSLCTLEGEQAGTISQYATLARGGHGTEIQTVLRIANYDAPNLDGFLLANSIELEENPVCVHPFVWRRSEFSFLPRVVVQERSEFRTRETSKIGLFFPRSTGFLAPQVNLIPFLLHDDPTRCLMGANMQRQAVALILRQKSIVSTGMESSISSLSGDGLYSLVEGIVTSITSKSIHLRDTFNREVCYLFPLRVCNQRQSRYYSPVVWEGERVFPGQLLVETQSICEGELGLGQNLILAYASWYGYTYEDSILLNEQLTYERTLTSVAMETRDILFNPNEQLTTGVPGSSGTQGCQLNTLGLSRVGSLIERGTIVIGKISLNYGINLPNKGFKILKPYQINAYSQLLGEEPKLVYCNKSLLGGRHFCGVLLYLGLLFAKDYSLEIEDLCVFRCILGRFRHVQSGDKLCGRHGNKGVVSAVWPQADLPYSLEGLVPDLIVSPLSVPSRMNVGQILETLLGLTGIFLDSRWKVPVFMENDSNIRYKRNIIYHKLQRANEYGNYKTLFNPYAPGKTLLRDGRTGTLVLGGSLMGLTYVFKLIHMVQDKVHVRSRGGYSEITQQPVHGKTKAGGQRFGEMEVWAMEAFGAAYELRDLLTLKADHVSYRKVATTAYLNDTGLDPQKYFPESWHFLMKTLNSLGIEIYK